MAYHIHAWFDPTLLMGAPENTYTGDIFHSPLATPIGNGDPTFHGYPGGAGDDDPDYPGGE